jgi:hypothetical protein
MSTTLISSQSVNRLLKLYKEECEDRLTPPGTGIDLAKIVVDMIKVSVDIAGLYDEDYLQAKHIHSLVEVVITEKRELTLTELNTLINALGTRLFLSFIERQLDYNNANAWDTGTSHALEVQTKLTSLLEIVDVLTDNPMDGELIGQSSD